MSVLGIIFIVLIVGIAMFFIGYAIGQRYTISLTKRDQTSDESEPEDEQYVLVKNPYSGVWERRRK